VKTLSISGIANKNC